MTKLGFLASATAALAGLAAAASSTASASSSSSSSSSSSNSNFPTIDVVGNKFFYSNNQSQFYIKGVAYQQDVTNGTSEQSYSDPLTDGSACKRDIPYLQKLSTNVIRVYAINTNESHDDCMQALQDAGIYVISDLSEPTLSINRNSPSWDVELYQRYTSVIDSLQKYPNVLGFFAGNELANNDSTTPADAFTKAAIRDMKSYMKSKNYRSIPVGYSAADVSDIRIAEADYYVCGDESERADFYGVNMYEWCGNATFQSSGYEARTQEFAKYPVPLFFSEYGCNKVQPREFTEVAALYSDEMTDVWSGGIVYMYFEETNNYGLVSVSGNSVSTLEDFNYLSKELASISPSVAKASSVTGTGSTVACPSTASTWSAASNLPPTPTGAVCDCVSEAASCVVADSTNATDYGQIFGYICGQIDCSAISANASSGEYGGLSYCDPKDQLNFLLNQYYNKQSKSASACDFSGLASVNKSPSTASSCASIVSQAASLSGTQGVSASATAGAGPDASGSGSSGSSNSSSTGKKKNAAVSVHSTGMHVASAGVLALVIAVAMVL